MWGTERSVSISKREIRIRVRQKGREKSDLGKGNTVLKDLEVRGKMVNSVN